MKTVRPARLRVPADIRALLAQKGLLAAFRARPPYQRIDYMSWIARATTTPTRNGRIEIMVDELAAGHGFMTMEWHPPRARAKNK